MELNGLYIDEEGLYYMTPDGEKIKLKANSIFHTISVQVGEGFTHICNRCGSTNVCVNSSDDGYYDYEEEWISCGSSLEIYCNDCGNGE